MHEEPILMVYYEPDFPLLFLKAFDGFKYEPVSLEGEEHIRDMERVLRPFLSYTIIIYLGWDSVTKDVINALFLPNSLHLSIDYEPIEGDEFLYDFIITNHNVRNVRNQAMDPKELRVYIETCLEGYVRNSSLDVAPKTQSNSIVFPPEYRLAGLQILNHFQETLNQKYPDNNVTVRIGQKVILSPWRSRHLMAKQNSMKRHWKNTVWL